LIQRFIADEGGIHAVQVVEELLEDVTEPEDDLREPIQSRPQRSSLGIVSNRLETKHVFFGVCLQSQLPEA
jgi:hypothetical protein